MHERHILLTVAQQQLTASSSSHVRHHQWECRKVSDRREATVPPFLNFPDEGCAGCVWAWVRRSELFTFLLLLLKFCRRPIEILDARSHSISRILSMVQNREIECRQAKKPHSRLHHQSLSQAKLRSLLRTDDCYTLLQKALRLRIGFHVALTSTRRNPQS